MSMNTVNEASVSSSITTAAAPTALPCQPRLLPELEVLDRSADEIQIGLDPRHGVIAGDLPKTLMQLLHRLDGSRSVDTLLELAGIEHAEQLRDVLTELTERGLVEDATTLPKPRAEISETGMWPLYAGHDRHATSNWLAHCAVTVYGGSRLAVAVATLLAASGVGHLDIRTSGTVGTNELGSGYTDRHVGNQRKHAIADAVRRTNPRTHVGTLTGTRRAELVLLTDTIVPAPEVVNELVVANVPHLTVKVREGTGIVGPLVMPGRSSCLRCADLHRTNKDSCWPIVASQLAGRDHHANLGSVQATAALATGQGLRSLVPGDQPPPTWNATLEIDSYEGTIQRRPWSPHPDCHCGAYARAW